MSIVLRERHWKRGACSRWRARTRAGCTPPPGAQITSFQLVGGAVYAGGRYCLQRCGAASQAEKRMIPGHRVEHDGSREGQSRACLFFMSLTVVDAALPTKAKARASAEVL